MSQEQNNSSEPKPSSSDKPPAVPLEPVVGLLGPKHTGMRVSAQGLLSRIADGTRIGQGQRFMVGELLKHLEMMAREFYGGNPKIVDEFLQLYALDDCRPNHAISRDGGKEEP